jgi:putative transposase
VPNVLTTDNPGHVWAYDFVEGRTHDGRKFRILTIIDEASRECLALIIARQLKHEDVLAALADLFIARGPPAHIRSDNVLCWEAAAGFSQQISMRRQPSARHAF